MRFVDPKNDVAFKKIFGADTSALKAAYETANRFSWSRSELEVYDYWQMKAQDEQGKVQAARKDAQTEIVQNMLAEGLEPSMIARVTPFSIEEIEEIAVST